MPKIANTADLSDFSQIRVSDYKDSLAAQHTPYISVSYQFKDKSYRYDVGITTTKCNYGGKRYWFICPKCSKRVGVLFCNGYYVCRHCIGVNYQTQLMQPIDKLFHKVAAIRQRLKWQHGIVNGHGERPKGMHKTTFNRLIAEHDAIVSKIIGVMSK